MGCCRCGEEDPLLLLLLRDGVGSRRRRSRRCLPRACFFGLVWVGGWVGGLKGVGRQAVQWLLCCPLFVCVGGQGREETQGHRAVDEGGGKVVLGWVGVLCGGFVSGVVACHAAWGVALGGALTSSSFGGIGECISPCTDWTRPRAARPRHALLLLLLLLVVVGRAYFSRVGSRHIRTPVPSCLSLSVARSEARWRRRILMLMLPSTHPPTHPHPRPTARQHNAGPGQLRHGRGRRGGAAAAAAAARQAQAQRQGGRTR